MSLSQVPNYVKIARATDDDRDILTMLSLNPEYCDEGYFKDIMGVRYPLLIKFRHYEESWKHFYVKMTHYIALLQENYNFPYIPHPKFNPETYYNKFEKCQQLERKEYIRRTELELVSDGNVDLESTFPSPDKVISKIAKKRTLNTIKNGVLTVSAYTNFEPVCYIDNFGNLAGIDVEIMKEFANLVGLDINFVIKDKFNGIWVDPPNGLSDVSIGGIGITPSRTKCETEWTIPYFYVNRTVVFNLKNPIKSFPISVTGIVRGTKGSTGYIDGEIKMKKAGKEHLMLPSSDDKDDIHSLLEGNIQGLIRGSFVGKSLVRQYPKQLGMVKPWEMDPSLVSSDGEVFAYPTTKDSGVCVLLTMMLTKLIFNGGLNKLIVKYKLD